MTVTNFQIFVNYDVVDDDDDDHDNSNNNSDAEEQDTNYDNNKTNNIHDKHCLITRVEINSVYSTVQYSPLQMISQQLGQEQQSWK